jgi:hypothetical protein
VTSNIYLKSQRFEQQTVLFQADEEMRHVYFPTSAVMSFVVTLETGDTIEAAMVEWTASSALLLR